jgi:hypothetical protein
VLWLHIGSGFSNCKIGLSKKSYDLQEFALCAAQSVHRYVLRTGAALLFTVRPSHSLPVILT